MQKSIFQSKVLKKLTHKSLSIKDSKKVIGGDTYTSLIFRKVNGSAKSRPVSAMPADPKK